MVKFHLNRAFKNRNNQIIFIIIILLHIFFLSIDLVNDLDTPLNYMYKKWVYLISEGHDNRVYYYFTEVYNNLFSIIVAVLPYSISYFNDRDNNRLSIIFDRSKRNIYFRSGLLVNFIISSLTFFIPNFIVYIMKYIAYPQNGFKPGIGLDLANYDGGIKNINSFSTLISSYPNLYSLIYIFIGTIYVGIFASIVYAFSLHVKSNKYVVLFVPIIIHFIITLLMEVLNSGHTFGAAVFISLAISNKRPYAFILVYIIQIIIFVPLWFIGKRKAQDIIGK